MLIRITSKQCKGARALLKWNIYDLAQRLKNIPPRRIESFEKDKVHILDWENKELVTAFRKAGIIFKMDVDVSLRTDEVAKDESDDKLHRHHGDGARIILDADQSIISDTTIVDVPQNLLLELEKKKQKEKEREKELQKEKEREKERELKKLESKDFKL
jgi:hypothetical protein